MSLARDTVKATSAPAGSEQRNVAIVIPCYNEEHRLNVERFRQFIVDDTTTTLIFVDDGSVDKTAEVIERIRSGHEASVTLLRRSPNAGKGEAVRTGMLDSIQRGFKYVGFFDADLSTPLEAVPDFLNVFDRYPDVAMVFGSRVRLLGREIERRPFRHYTGRVFATAASLLLRLPVYDTQCGAKLFRVTPELRQILDAPFVSRWIFDVELLARLIRLRRSSEGVPVERSVQEVPLWRWKDVSGSKLGLTDVFGAACDLVRIYRGYLR